MIEELVNIEGSGKMIACFKQASASDRDENDSRRL